MSRQDYITRVSYKNDLPPPTCPPRILKYTSTISNHDSLISDGILSSLFRKQNFKKYINLPKDGNTNDPLALNLDLIEVPELFEQSGAVALHELPFSKGDQSKGITLHEKDKGLLRNPDFNLKKEASRSLPGGDSRPGAPSVAFLRKTEYISNKSHFLGAKNQHSQTPNKKRTVDDLTADAQLRNIEQSFEEASKTLSGDGFQNLRHPIKKHLRPVKAWSLIPNSENMDQAYFSTKFLGSASLHRSKQEKTFVGELSDKSNNGINNHNPIYTTSIFKPIALRDEEWMSFFTMDDLEKSKALKRKLDSVELDEEETFKFKFNKYYDLKYEDYDTSQAKQIAISLGSNKPGGSANLEAKYLPIQGKIELKKKRLNPESLADDENDGPVHFDQILFTVRESTAEEETERDRQRSKYDPYNYVAQIDEEEEEEEEEVVQEED